MGGEGWTRRGGGSLSTGEIQALNLAHAVVVGDSIWDLLAARRAATLGVGLLSGGCGREELERAGAYRVYADPADLLLHLDEVGIRRDTGWLTDPSTGE
ncbi:MAG: HAD family hydrolase [Pseudonocardiaceae bacterium]